MVDQPEDSGPRAGASGEFSPWSLVGLGTQFFVGLLAFGFAGNWLDARFSTSPVFLLAGVLLGGGGTFYAGYRQAMRRLDAAEQDRSGRSDSSSPR